MLESCSDTLSRLKGIETFPFRLPKPFDRLSKRSDTLSRLKGIETPKSVSIWNTALHLVQIRFPV